MTNGPDFSEVCEGCPLRQLVDVDRAIIGTIAVFASDRNEMSITDGQESTVAITYYGPQTHDGLTRQTAEGIKACQAPKVGVFRVECAGIRGLEKVPRATPFVMRFLERVIAPLTNTYTVPSEVNSRPKTIF